MANEKVLGYDTETTTLWWWASPHIPITPRVFAAQFATKLHAWYIDFEHSEDKLNDTHWVRLQTEIFSNPEILWYIHNAKFDMHQSANHGVSFAGTVHCTQAMARVLNNLEGDHKKGGLKLDTLSEKYLGQNKIEIDFPKTKIKKWGKNDKYEDLAHFNQMPLDKLIEYGLKDTRLAYDLGQFQIREIANIDSEIYSKLPWLKTKTLTYLMEQERKLTKVLFKMEREGVQIDRQYTEKAYYNEVAEYEKCKAQFDETCQKEIGKNLDLGSPRQLKELFDKLGEPYAYTDKGNACFDSDALERSNAVIAKLILKYRYHYKRAHTYFENFIWLSDTNGVIHCDLQQAGTETGRLSCWNPNLQNVSKTADNEEKLYPVRRCFVPRPGFIFVDLDYQAAEYRMMLDYAGEENLIEKVAAGLDVHVATKQELQVSSRHEAKTLNFMLLYGGGYQKLADALKISLAEAKRKKLSYFERLPGVKRFIYQVRDIAASRGFVINWAGRMLKYSRDTSFKAPNGLIQGGVGDMGKHALIGCSQAVENTPHKLLLQVHDSLLFEILEGSQIAVVQELKSLMESIYTYKKLPMAVDGGYSKKSWADLEDLPSML